LSFNLIEKQKNCTLHEREVCLKECEKETHSLIVIFLFPTFPLMPANNFKFNSLKALINCPAFRAGECPEKSKLQRYSRKHKINNIFDLPF